MSTRSAAAGNAVVNTISKHTTPTRVLAVGLAVSLSYLVYAGMNALQCRQEVEEGGYDAHITELAKAG